MNENENLQPVQKLTPFTKMVMSIGTLPSSFYASMSYYESMVWLYEYLKNEVIPTVNNNAEAVEELQEAFTTLQTFINEYFNNLDVQEEINKKLDEMAEDGTITNLIKNYVDPYIDSQNQTIANFENDVNTTLSNYNNKINSLYNYSPIPVSNTSAMTDTSKIYVNTTDGKWYYYDGDSWEIGGTYQSSSNDELLDDESTNAVQNKILTNALSNIVNINTDNAATFEETTIPKLTAGFIAANGAIASSEIYYYSQKINVNEGDTIFVIAKTYQGDTYKEKGEIRFLCAYDENDTAVTEKGSNAAIRSYTVPAGISSVVVSCVLTGNMLIVRSYTSTLQSIISKYEKSKNVISSISNVSVSTTSGLIDAGGAITPNASYEYTNDIEVSKGDIIIPLCNGTTKARIFTAYIGDNAVTQYGASTTLNDLTSYTVPNDYITKIKICLPTSSSINSVIKIHHESVNYIDKNLGGYSYHGNPTTGEVISFDVVNLKPSYNINFSAHITTLDKIQIGLLNGDTFSELFAVDNTNLETYSGNAITTGAHGLTIANDLAISARIEPYNMNGYDMANVTIFSNGQEYSTKSNRNIYTYNYSISSKIALKINNSVISDCSFSVGIENIDKPIWIFGDSWISNYEQRWVHWLYANDNAKNCYFNGYPGENSANGLIALKNSLKLKTPKYLLWLYGMNDTDTTVINSSWLSCLNEVIEICKEKNIELILCTIPSSSTQLNQKKNDIVRNSGYRYFDQAGALEFNGTWLSAYKTDNAHPTTEGAKALYYKLLTDVPEITNYR